MKIKLTRALAQAGRVVPAGVILSDAPPALMRKLVAEGRAEWHPATNAPEGLSDGPQPEDRGKHCHEAAPASAGVAPGLKSKPARKRVMRGA